MRIMLLCLAFSLGLGMFAAQPAAADECWLTTPPGYKSIGGKSVLGPYPDWYAANRVNNQYFNGQGSISCTKSRGTSGGSTPRFKYGSIQITNRTGLTLWFQVRSSPGGSWGKTTLKSGHSWWYWQECPCRYHISWDGSTRSGNQIRNKELFWYGYQRKPTGDDGRHWQLVQRGSRIDVIEGSTAPIAKPKPKATGSRTVSFVGRGTGKAHNNTLRDSKVASGDWKLDFMPRVNGQIPTLSGTWTLTWKKLLGDKNAKPRTELWTLRMKGLRGSTRSVVNVRMKGGVGTANSVTTRVPLHSAAGLIKLKVHLTFSKKNARVSFTRSY